MIPKRLKRPRMGLRESSVIRCQGHLKWVRGHQCCIAFRRYIDTNPIEIETHICEGRIEAHHVREGANGGVGLKPDDSTAVPLCSHAHKRGHDKGWKSFERAYGIDLTEVAAKMWKASPHRIAYEQKQQQY